MFKQCLMVSVLTTLLLLGSNGPDHKYKENGYLEIYYNRLILTDYGEFDVRVKLAEVAQSVSDSLNEMVRVEKSVNPSQDYPLLLIPLK